MQYIGQGSLVTERHSTGVQVKILDLSPFGGDRIFLGPVNSPLPTGTADYVPGLRVEFPSLKVYRVTASSPPPSFGPKGGIKRKVALPKWLLPVAAVASFFWFKGGFRRRA